MVVDGEDEKWIRETYAKVLTEIRNTGFDGRSFANTIQVILERDKNWVRWKNDICPPMDKTAAQARLNRATRDAGKDEETLKREDEERWNNAFRRFVPSSEGIDPDPPQPYGTENLEEIWEYQGVKELDDLKSPYEIPTIDRLANQLKGLEYRKESVRKKKGLPPRPPAIKAQSLQPAPRPPTETDPSSMDVDRKDPKLMASPARPSGSPAPRGPQYIFDLEQQETDPELQEFDYVRGLQLIPHSLLRHLIPRSVSNP